MDHNDTADSFLMIMEEYTALETDCQGKNRTTNTNNGELIFGVDNVSYGQEYINRNGRKFK